MKYLVNGVMVPLSQDPREIRTIIARKLSIPENSFRYEIVNRGLRYSPEETYLKCQVVIDTANFVRDTSIGFYKQIPELIIQPSRLKDRPVIIGAGLAGLFAGLVLAEAGARPIIIEMGKDLPKREKDVEGFEKNGDYMVFSNYTRGLGGKNGFCGGLISTERMDSYTQYALDRFLQFGMPSTAKLDETSYLSAGMTRDLCRRVVSLIKSCGGEFHFERRFSNITRFLGSLTGIEYAEGLTRGSMKAKHVLLTVGIPYRPLLKHLVSHHVPLQKQKYYLGFHIEHRQHDFDNMVFGHGRPHLDVPALNISEHLRSKGKRDIFYGFARPNGKVINVSNTANEVVFDSGFPNSAESTNMVSSLLCSVSNLGAGEKDLWSEEQFLYSLFSSSFHKEIPCAAPSELLEDFMEGREPFRFGRTKTSATRGAYLYSLQSILPIEVSNSLKEAIEEISRKFPIFREGDPIITGLTLGNSYPVGIEADEDGRTKCRGVYAALPPSGKEETLLEEAARGIKAALTILNEG